MGDEEHPVGDDGREVAAIDHCLYSIWDDDMLSKFTADDGVKNGNVCGVLRYLAHGMEQKHWLM